ncbi:hypothetical protein C8F04DRAFT_1139111 [Mycena alexandri]|uniref:Uncharacterized protein n=1 Tax=Mycena alexandri TaxID=1745969 RepID=A0AAD6SAN3_9AGAR|nr:hypothetical protein C8F04DRAFT_1139111 [Mycena alexandri]
MPTQKFIFGFVVGVPSSLAALAAIDALKNGLIRGEVSTTAGVLVVLTTNLCVLNIILLRPRLRSTHLQIKTAFKTSALPPLRDQQARTVPSISQHEHDAVPRSLPVLLVLILFNYALAFGTRFASRSADHPDADQAQVFDTDSDDTLIDESESKTALGSAPASPATPSPVSPSILTVTRNHLELPNSTSSQVKIEAVQPRANLNSSVAATPVPPAPVTAVQNIIVKAKSDWKPLRPISFQWARGGCSTRITILPPTPLHGSASEFVPKVCTAGFVADKNTGRASAAASIVVAPPVVVAKKPLFLATPPTFWRPGGCAVPIVAPVNEFCALVSFFGSLGALLAFATLFKLHHGRSDGFSYRKPWAGGVPHLRIRAAHSSLFFLRWASFGRNICLSNCLESG